MGINFIQRCVGLIWREIEKYTADVIECLNGVSYKVPYLLKFICHFKTISSFQTWQVIAKVTLKNKQTPIASKPLKRKTNDGCFVALGSKMFYNATVSNTVSLMPD